MRKRGGVEGEGDQCELGEGAVSFSLPRGGFLVVGFALSLCFLHRGRRCGRRVMELADVKAWDLG